MPAPVPRSSFAWIVVLTIPWSGTAVARASEPVSEDAILTATAKLETALEELRDLESRWQQLANEESAEAAARLEKVAVLEAELAAADRRSPEVDALYDRVIPVLRWALDEVAEAIERAQRPSELPYYAQSGRTDAARARLFDDVPPFDSVDVELSPSQVSERLEELEKEVRETALRLQTLELQSRLAEVARDVELASRVYLARLAALENLSLKRRARVVSFRGEAREALRLELDTAEIVLRLHLFRARALIAGARFERLLSILLAGGVLLRLVLLALVWRWAQREYPRFLSWQRRKAESLEDPQLRAWATRVVDFLQALARWGIYLVGIAAIGWMFGAEASELPLFSILLALAASYGAYRLAVDVAVAAAVVGMESGGLEVPSAVHRKVGSSLRWIARAAFVVFVVLWLCVFRLGRGVLFFELRRWGVLFIGLVFLAMLWRMSREVRDAFLAQRAHGRLADLVRKTRRDWTRHLLAVPAFFWLLGHGVVGVMRAIAFSFERTRTATAYLSRRRMLKVAEERGHIEVSPEELPPELVAALDEYLKPSDIESISEFAGLDVVARSAAAWREGRAGGSMLLAGEDGLGKRAWLEHFFGLESDGLHLRLETRVQDPAEIRSWLADRLLSTGGGPIDRDTLVEELRDGPKRVVVLDGAENLFLATVNGYGALTELAPIIDGTRRQVFWLLVMKGLAWNHLKAAGKELAFLRRKFVLPTWGEKQIRDLVNRRLELAEFECDYADLMALHGRREDALSRHRLGKAVFTNLLWDFTGGNPQLALHFFLRSLEVPARGPLRVRPFVPPPEDELSSAGDGALFLLAALMRHGSLSVAHAATTTAYPVGRVEGLFLRLLDLGAVAENGGAYHVTTTWRASVLRVLRRRNILIS